MRKTKWYILIVALVIMESITLFLMYKSFNNKGINVITEEMLFNKQQFAIQVENDAGIYEDWSGTGLPGDGYELNTTNTKCYDTNWEEKTDKSFLNYSGGNLTISLFGSVFCNLRFDKKSNVIENIKENMWCTGLEGDGCRYIGEEPNNYICFGTSDKDLCLNNKDKYLYRIIGIFPDESEKEHLKLIKYVPLYEKASNSGYRTTAILENTGMHIENMGYVCNDDYQGIGYNLYSESLGKICYAYYSFCLLDLLNGEFCGYYPFNYDDENVKEGSVREYNDPKLLYTDKYIFKNSDNYEYLNDNNIWYKKISNWDYKIVYNTYDNSIDYIGQTGRTVYYHEKNMLEKLPTRCYNGSISCTYESSSWTTYNKKIGYMYMRDVFLSSGVLDNEGVGVSSWITLQYNDTIPNTYGVIYDYIMAMKEKSYNRNTKPVFYKMYFYGNLGISGDVYDSNNVRPVFYLNNDVELANQEFTENTGSISNPLLIKE